MEFIAKYFDEEGKLLREQIVSGANREEAKFVAIATGHAEKIPYARVRLLSNSHNATRLRQYWNERNSRVLREPAFGKVYINLTESEYKKWEDIHKLTGVKMSKLLHPVVSKHIRDTWDEYYNPDGTLRNKLGNTKKFVSVLGRQYDDSIRLDFTGESYCQGGYFNVILTDADIDRLVSLYDKKYGDEE